MAQQLTNMTRIHEDVGSIPGLPPCVEDLALLWLWSRPAAAALIRPLAWEPPHCHGCSLKKTKKKKKKKKDKKIQHTHTHTHVYRCQKRPHSLPTKCTYTLPSQPSKLLANLSGQLLLKLANPLFQEQLWRHVGFG